MLLHGEEELSLQIELRLVISCSKEREGVLDYPGELK